MTEVQYLHPDASSYPIQLQKFPCFTSLPTISAIGNLAILKQPALALFCSTKCPGNLILQTYDLAVMLRDTGVPVISGFHSPMEQECFTLLLRGTQPVIYCPARSLENMRLAAEWKEAIAQNRLLLLSPFPAKQRRVTAKLAQTRNSFVATLAETVFIAYAAPGSKTELFAHQLLDWGKPVLTLENPDNQRLISAGAKPMNLDAFNSWNS